MNRIWTALLFFSLGLIVLPLSAFLYLTHGNLPVAVADKPFPDEKYIAHKALSHRINAELESYPGPATDSALMVGAAVYSKDCAFCHGNLNADSPLKKHMYPSAPQLWHAHRAGVVGVSDDPVGETFWKVKNGIRLSGMPSYKDLLSEEQMWDVSLLLSSAAKPLPKEVEQSLKGQDFMLPKEKP